MPTRRFEPAPESSREARRFVQEVLGDHELLDTALLLVSELATNASQHTGLPFEVQLSTLPSIRVAVRDADPRIPVVNHSPIVEAEHGRGLPLVQALSTRWGITAEAGGKTIWFEL